VLKPSYKKDNVVYTQVMSLDDFYDVLETSDNSYVAFYIPELQKEFKVLVANDEIGAIVRDANGVSHLVTFRKKVDRERKEFQKKLEEYMHVITLIDRGLVFYVV